MKKYFSSLIVLLLLVVSCDIFLKQDEFFYKEIFLNNLKVDKGVLSAKFSKDTTNYTHTVKHDTYTITYIPEINIIHDKLEYSFSGSEMKTISQGSPLKINIEKSGKYKLIFKLTAQDKSTTISYIINIVREFDAEIESIGLSAGLNFQDNFSPQCNSHTLIIDETTDSFTLNPMLSSSEATIEIAIGSGAYTSLNASNIDLEGNSLVIKYRVTNDFTKNTYVLTIEKPKYTITFNKNSETATGTMKNIISFSSEEYTLPSNSFENQGYIFKGWDLTTNAETPQYSDKSLLSFNADITLYACWEEE